MTDLYRIKKSQYSPNDPSTYIDIDQGSINTTATSLKLVGRTREYGEEYNENILHLLENHASPEVSYTQTYSVYHAIPAHISNPVNGQNWFNTSRKLMYVYFSGRWYPNAYASNVASNWGTVTHGMPLPRPVAQDGYVFSYSECAWVISPALIPTEASGMTCSVNPTTGVVTATLNGATATPFEVFYQIIGVRGNNEIGGSDAAFKVRLSSHLSNTSVPSITTFPRQIVSTTPVTATAVGAAPSSTLVYEWIRVFPTAQDGFPAGYIIEPIDADAASTAFQLTVTSPGIFPPTQRVVVGATYLCKITEHASDGAILNTQLSLPVRVEFANY